MSYFCNLIQKPQDGFEKCKEKHVRELIRLDCKGTFQNIGKKSKVWTEVHGIDCVGLLKIHGIICKGTYKS